MDGSFERRQKGQGTEAKETNSMRLMMDIILEDALKIVFYYCFKLFLNKELLLLFFRLPWHI